MKFFRASVLAALATAVIASPAPAVEQEVKKVSYDGYRVFRVWTHGQPNAIREKLDAALPGGYTEWVDDGAHLDVVVPPAGISDFETLEGKLKYKVIHEDLGASITGESADPVPSHKWRRQEGGDNDAWFDSYHNYEDHIQFFKDIQASFPNNSKIVSSGKSLQNRNIFGIHLYGSGGPGKKAIVYHGTVHAREWIAAPVLEYITHQLASGYSSGDELVTTILDKYDFFIFPIVNPDGFIYSQVADRLWRKGRHAPPASAPDQRCLGRDINRNWEFGWDSDPRGASTNPCAQTYRGEAPSDTPENKGLDAFLRQLRNGPGIKLFIDWHSYGQYILSPYGNRETLYAPELGKWTKAANLLSEAIRDSSPARTTFTFGPSGAVLYPTTGAAPDHAYSIARAEFSYTIELRDTGDFGFVLPPELIRPTVEEQWAGQKELLPILDEEFFDGIGEVL